MPKYFIAINLAKHELREIVTKAIQANIDYKPSDFKLTPDRNYHVTVEYFGFLKELEDINTNIIDVANTLSPCTAAWSLFKA